MKLSDLKSARWKDGSRCKGSAIECAKELQDIKRKDGGVLLPSSIVARAVDESNPLHPNFTWDNDIASLKYREEQARKLVRSISFEPKTKKGGVSRPVSLYTSVSLSPKKETKQRGYVTVDEALSDPIMRDEVLSRAIREALSYRKKYAELSELSKIFHAIDEMLMSGEAV